MSGAHPLRGADRRVRVAELLDLVLPPHWKTWSLSLGPLNALASLGAEVPLSLGPWQQGALPGLSPGDK